jgi:hypothetical protein
VEKITELLGDAEFWVAVAFVLFVAGMGYLGVHKMVAKSLDERTDKIKAELDEARKLKDEAAQLLAEYQRKRQQAEVEAQDIITGWRSKPRPRSRNSSPAAPRWPRPKSPRPRLRPPPTSAPPRPTPPLPRPRRS